MLFTAASSIKIHQNTQCCVKHLSATAVNVLLWTLHTLLFTEHFCLLFRPSTLQLFCAFCGLPALHRGAQGGGKSLS